MANLNCPRPPCQNHATHRAKAAAAAKYKPQSTPDRIIERGQKPPASPLCKTCSKGSLIRAFCQFNSNPMEIFPLRRQQPNLPPSPPTLQQVPNQITIRWRFAVCSGTALLERGKSLIIIRMYSIDSLEAIFQWNKPHQSMQINSFN